MPQKTRPNPRTRTHSPAPATRPPLERMLRIHELLAANTFPNCSSLAARFEVSSKTIQRDLDFMRDRWNLPIAYHHARRGYHYTAPVHNFPALSITQGELLSLLVAQKALAQYRGTPFEEPIAAAFNKLASLLDSSQAVSLHQLAGAFSFKTTAPAPAELETFSLLTQAIAARRTVRFTYTPLTTTSQAGPRTVQPWHIACIADQWYLIGRDLLRKARRTFALPRISGVTLLSQTFTPPSRFSLNAMLASSFSAFETPSPQPILIRLSPLAARLAAERKWHPSQTLRPLPGGAAELRLTVGIAPDLENWLLSWGEHAEVLEPLSLRQTLARRHRKAAKLHALPTPTTAAPPSTPSPAAQNQRQPPPPPPQPKATEAHTKSNTPSRLHHS